MIKFISSFNDQKSVEDYLIRGYGHLLHCGNVLYEESVVNWQERGHSLYLQGHLYNGKELADANCIDFRCDAQVVLALYLVKGEGSFSELDGNFTLFIKSADQSLIYRDRHGAGAQVYYSSEFFTNALSVFKRISGFRIEPDSHSIYTFLELGYIPSPSSSLKGVQKLPAGNLLVYKNGNLAVRDLFGYEQFSKEKTKVSVEEAIEEYERLHKQAIQRRIDGKQNVALLLSGGYDSGGNISALRDIYPGKLTGFSVGFKNNPWTEVPLAKLMADRFGADFHDYTIDGSEIDHLPQIIAHLGDPFQEAGLMVNFCAMRMVGDHQPDVVLGGDGNDQHFGTFGKEAALNYGLRRYGLRAGQKVFSAVSKNDFFENDNILFRARFHNEKILNVLRSDSFGFKNHQFHKLLTGKPDKIVHEYAEGIPASFSSYDEMYSTRNYFVDLKQVVNEVILFKASKMAELYNNNITFPYMDTDIYNFLKTLPRDYKLRGSLSDIAKGKGVAKYLHKAYLKPKLPKEITQRKKQGGFAPLSIFFTDVEKRSQIKDFILKSSVTRAMFNPGYVEQVFEQYDQLELSGGYWFWYKQVKSTQLFNLLVIAIWWEIMVEGNHRETLTAYFV